MSQLEILTQNRDALLLAEAIGCLHDYRKCSDEHLRAKASNLSGGGGLPHNELTNRFPALAGISINLMGESCFFADLLRRRPGATCNLLPGYLSRCHHTAHFDKQEPDGGEQNYPGVQVSSPFGFEQHVSTNLTNYLWSSLPWAGFASYSVSDRANMIKKTRELFAQVGADTRRPINEVALWDWGILVGTLYKASLAGALLASSPIAARDLHWRLLSVRVNGLAYMLNVARLPDLLGRRQILADSLEQVRLLLEETYPLGNEVYRDENGSLYVVADLPNLLNFANAKGQPLRELIFRAFEQGTLKNDGRLRIGGEILPVVELDANPWWGQDPDWQTKQSAGIALQNEIPPVGSILSRAIISQPKIEFVEGYWQRHVADICTVCSLRPQGPGEKANSRKVCDVCEERRLDRSKAWATEQTAETIWIDEVSDTNGRLAFLVGQFDLTDWLNGKLVESLVLVPPPSPEREVKAPSFSRIRRIWKTTERFWIDVLKDTFTQLLSDDRRRLLLWLDEQPDLAPFHVYDFDLGRTTLSVVWYPSQTDGKGGYLISADNLGHVARQLEAEKAIYDNPASAANWIEDYVQERFVTGSQQPVLRNPDQAATERNRNLLAERLIVETEHQDAAYSTAIPILAEPRTFMALVPADRALDIVNAVRQKYQREMGKARNRLPLRLGVIYFPRRTPIRAALDAGQTMLQQKPMGDTPLWSVLATPVQQANTDLPSSGLKEGTRQFDHWYAVNLAQNNRLLTWYVPAVMGDGCTEDNWFPYVFIETHDDDSEMAGRQLAFKGKRPTANGDKDCWLIHVGELKEGDEVYFAPASFDFEWLDTSGRRFEIAYDEQGERYSRYTRPWLLDDLDRLEALWNLMKCLKTSQRHQVTRTIEATREAWYGSDEGGQAKNDGVFRQFVADTLAGAEWRKGQPWKNIPQELRDKLVQAGTSGELADLAELHMEILKER